MPQAAAARLSIRRRCSQSHASTATRGSTMAATGCCRRPTPTRAKRSRPTRQSRRSRTAASRPTSIAPRGSCRWRSSPPSRPISRRRRAAARSTTCASSRRASRRPEPGRLQGAVMEVLRGIPNAIAGEQVLATVPALAPYVTPITADGGEAALRKRLNLFAQRALTHVALTDEQRNRIADAMTLGRSVAPGVVEGFEVALEGAGDATALVLMPGHAIGSDGADIELAYPLRVPYRQLPVFAPEIDALLRTVIEADPKRDYDRLTALEKLVSIERLVSPELNKLDLLPHAMVLVAMPRTVAIDSTGELDTPCPNATG